MCARVRVRVCVLATLCLHRHDEGMIRPIHILRGGRTPASARSGTAPLCCHASLLIS
jgi:hypothetical protein